MYPISFIPGPSALYFTVKNHINQGIQHGIWQESHRSPAFKTMYADTIEALTALLQVPDGFHIVFTSSATEVWEKSLDNFVEKTTLHLVNGAFSKRFYDYAVIKGLDAQKIEAPRNACVNIDDIPADIKTPELISVTLNESSTGAAQPLDDVKKLRHLYPDAIIGIDTVSDTPYSPLNYDALDFYYFSVQKCFGLPSGLGVWILNDRCLHRATTLKEKGQVIGTYRDVLQLVEKSQNFQTIETPNIPNIYLLGKVAQDMLQKGLDKIRQEIDYKAALLYQTSEQVDYLKASIHDEAFRSKTVTVFDCKEAQDLLLYFKEKNILLAGGYGNKKTSQIRIANFPTHSKEQIEMVVDLLKSNAH